MTAGCWRGLGQRRVGGKQRWCQSSCPIPPGSDGTGAAFVARRDMLRALAQSKWSTFSVCTPRCMNCILFHAAVP